MAITPTGISWLDQWILSQGGTLAGQDTDVPPVTSPQPTYESSRRFLKRYIEGSDDYDSNPTGGYAPDIGIGESFQSLITSSAGLFDKFDVGSIVDVEEGAKELFSGGLEGLIEGVKLDFNNFYSTQFDPLNTYTTYNQGPWGNAIRAMQDPSVGWQRALGAATIPIGMMAIPGANLFGALASALNSMGAYHSFTNADSNIEFNESTGKLEWDSTDPGGGGIQWGRQNALNSLEDLAERDPDAQIAVTAIDDETGNKYTVGYVDPMTAWAAYGPGVEGWGLSTGEELEGFTTGPNWSNQMSMDFPGMTNSEAFSSLSNMTGNAFNAVMGEAYAQGLGYNEAISAAQQAADEMAGDWSTGPYGGTSKGMSLDDAFAAAMEEAGPTGTVDSGSAGDSGGADGAGMSGSMSTESGESYDWGGFY
jgi:hypothetical protein